MRRIKLVTTIILTAIMCSCLVGRIVPAQADTINAPSLTIAQLKITSANGQFVTLYNPTNTTLDMAKYQLVYFNNYDLTKATSTRTISLAGSLPPHGYYMINDSELQLCYQLAVNSVSLGFSSTAGLVEVLALNQSSPGGLVTSSLQDHVGWSKTAASGAQTLPTNTNAFLLRQPLDSQGNPLVQSPGSGSWLAVQPDTDSPCHYITNSASPTEVTTGLSQLLPPDEPPVNTESIADSSAVESLANLPATDVGLMSPRMTELLPNPAGTGNDTTNEFIELYNANDTNFDLSGFSLQTGTTTLHTYVFPAGTTLAPHSFTAFYSSLTHLSMSNSGGQAVLLDPLGNSLSASSPYATAADGQAWAYASGNWSWTTTPTPNAPNIIHKPIAKTKSKKAASKSKTASKKGLKTAAHKLPKNTKATASYQQPASSTPIHIWTLALVGGLALLYGAYEYRTDLANHYRQLKGHFVARFSSRSTD